MNDTGAFPLFDDTCPTCRLLVAHVDNDSRTLATIAGRVLLSMQPDMPDTGEDWLRLFTIIYAGFRRDADEFLTHLRKDHRLAARNGGKPKPGKTADKTNDKIKAVDEVGV